MPHGGDRKRVRRPVEIVLSPEARAILDRLGVEAGSRSAAVERLLLDAWAERSPAEPLGKP
jgi:hypothetical protein